MSVEEYRKGLVCLVPRKGLGGITCHEKTLCDCQVLEIFAELDKVKLQLTFVQEYLNPSDTSFRTMIDTFQTLDPSDKDKMIELSKALAAFYEADRVIKNV